MKRFPLLLLICLLGSELSAQETCMQPDVNCDGYVNVNDLLGLLGYFGDEDLDGDGVWDSQDDCVDDGCGVCDGPGPQVLVIDTITFTPDSIFIETINEWYVFEVPDTTFTFVCTNPGCTDPLAENYDPYASEDDGNCDYGGPIQCDMMSTLTFQDYTYELIAIGDQCWFAENLRSSFYANGDLISSNLSMAEWEATIEGATAVYGEGSSLVLNGNSDEAVNLSNYGRLYNCYAVNDERGLCPSGWHVPTDEEFFVLETELGMDASEWGVWEWRGTDQGTQMKSAPIDNPSWDGTNVSGFAALPGGLRSGPGYFQEEGNYCEIWTSTTLGDGQNVIGVYRRVITGAGGVYRAHQPLNRGYSVRCLKDTE